MLFQSIILVAVSTWIGFISLANCKPDCEIPDNFVAYCEVAGLKERCLFLNMTMLGSGRKNCTKPVPCEKDCCVNNEVCVYKKKYKKFKTLDKSVAAGHWISLEVIPIQHDLARMYTNTLNAFYNKYKAESINDTNKDVIVEASEAHRLLLKALNRTFVTTLHILAENVTARIADAPVPQKAYGRLIGLSNSLLKGISDDFAAMKCRFDDLLVQLKAYLYLKYRDTKWEEAKSLEPFYVKLCERIVDVVEGYKLTFGDLTASMEEFNETVQGLAHYINPMIGSLLPVCQLARVLVSPHMPLLRAVKIPSFRIPQVVNATHLEGFLLDAAIGWLNKTQYMTTLGVEAIGVKLTVMVKLENAEIDHAGKLREVYFSPNVTRDTDTMELMADAIMNQYKATANRTVYSYIKLSQLELKRPDPHQSPCKKRIHQAVQKFILAELKRSETRMLMKRAFLATGINDTNLGSSTSGPAVSAASQANTDASDMSNDDPDDPCKPKVTKRPGCRQRPTTIAPTLPPCKCLKAKKTKVPTTQPPPEIESTTEALPDETPPPEGAPSQDSEAAPSEAGGASESVPADNFAMLQSNDAVRSDAPILDGPYSLNLYGQSQTYGPFSFKHSGKGTQYEVKAIDYREGGIVGPVFNYRVTVRHKAPEYEQTGTVFHLQPLSSRDNLFPEGIYTMLRGGPKNTVQFSKNIAIIALASACVLAFFGIIIVATAFFTSYEKKFARFRRIDDPSSTRSPPPSPIFAEIKNA